MANTAMTTTMGAAPAAIEPNMGERFMQKVIVEFGGGAPGELRITDYQRSLAQGYFIAIDRVLKTSEEERVRKNEGNRDHKYDNALPFTWSNVNLPELARDVVHYARLGLDMMQPAMLYPIPYKNNKTQKYDVTLMEGYNGIRFIAENYALVKPKSVTIDLVYSTDKFRPIKKGFNHPVESYEFEITNPFDRGEIIGGFGYIEYDDPARNELVIMTLKDIEKRKPKYASANFWGGEATEWVNGKKETVEKDGWFGEMCLKTICRAVYGAKYIPRDPRKIDESYQLMKQQEMRLREVQDEVRNVITVSANTVPLDETAAESPVAIPASERKESESVPQSSPTDNAQTGDTHSAMFAAGAEYEAAEDLSDKYAGANF